MRAVKTEISNLVVGLGEVGAAVREVLECDGHDPFKNIMAKGHQYDVLHVCFPYNQSAYDFVSEVQKYKNIFSPSLVVIHSTVPVGTTHKLGAIHSPIRGVHPNIAKGIRTFVKFFGGPKAEKAADIFRKKGVTTHCTPHSEETEAGKLWDTTQYGLMILLNKEIHRYCKENGLDFDVVYTMFNRTYNEGYRELGRHEVVRPFLKHVDGPIGGHCVVPNAHILNSPIAKKILEENAVLQAQTMSQFTKSKVTKSKVEAHSNK